MDHYTTLLDLLLDLPSVKPWPELRDVLGRATAKRDRNWLLPGLACEAVGGHPQRAILAMAAIACEQVSIILLDDLLDADPRGEHQRIGAPAAANLAAALQAAGLEALAQSRVDASTKLAALHSLNHMALTTAFGQHLDVQNPSDEEAYWQVVRTKSAPFFGTALQLGALLGGAARETAEEIRQLGCLYGEMIQIHDDLHDTMAVPANPDWTLGRSPLPILFAQNVAHPERKQFLELRWAIPDPSALAEAQAILVRCGAVSYGIYHLCHRHNAARELLERIPLQDPDGLSGLLEDQFRPVSKLFAGLGIAVPKEFSLARTGVGE